MFNENTTENNFYGIIILFRIKIYKKDYLLVLCLRGGRPKLIFT